MGEARKDALRLDFDRRSKLEFHGTKVTNGAKIRFAEEKPVAEVRRNSAKMLDFHRIGVSWGLSGRCMDRVDGQNP